MYFALMMLAAFFAGNLSALYLLKTKPALRTYAASWRGYAVLTVLFFGVNFLALKSLEVSLDMFPVFLLCFAASSFCFTIFLSGSKRGK